MTNEEYPKERLVLIDKACEWLEDMASYYHSCKWNDNTHTLEVVGDVERLVNDFRRAMES